jgi:CelD/BcsL family acetyltransferase involved in cellulose biosynthesis
MIDVRHYRTFAELQSIRAELTAIHGRSRRQCPFSTVDYLQAFQENDEFHPAGDHSQLWFLVACENGVALAYVALRRVDERVFGVLAHKLEFLATHDTDRPHVVSAPADEERATCAFYDFLLAHGESWSFLELRQQDTVSQGHGALLTSANHYVRRFESPQNSTIHITWPDAEAYYRSLSKKARSNTARQFRNLVASGHVLYLSSDSPRALPALFDLYLKVEARSWKSQVDGTIARHPSRLAFFRRLLGSDQPMRLCISLLLLDGVPIAGLIDGVMGRSLFALQIAFDELQFKLSPGATVLFLSLRRAIEQKLAFYNLLSGFSYYKSLALAETADTQTVQLFRKGSPHYWKARGGSYLRSILGVDPEKAARFSLVKSGTLQHNPFRVSSSPVPVAAANRVDPLAISALIDLGVECYDADEIAGLLPFDLYRASA